MTVHSYSFNLIFLAEGAKQMLTAFDSCWYSATEKPLKALNSSVRVKTNKKQKSPYSTINNSTFCLVSKKGGSWWTLCLRERCLPAPRPSSHPPGWQEPLQARRGRLRERAAETARKRLRGQESEEDRERRRAQGGTGVDRRRGGEEGGVWPT